jgi:glycosyl transferase family 25
MIPIYLISLEQDIKRREELQQRFPKNYNNFILIKAIDGRKLSAKDYYDKTITYFIEKKQIMSPAELGCTFSHIKALKEFLKTDAKLV